MTKLSKLLNNALDSEMEENCYGDYLLNLEN